MVRGGEEEGEGEKDREEKEEGRVHSCATCRYSGSPWSLGLEEFW